MTSSINLNNFNYQDGKLQFSGLSSGIDFQSAIEAILLAKRQPAVLIEQKIAVNNQKLTDMGELKSLAMDFTNSLDVLRGPTSSTSTDIFEQKLAFTESFATATAPVGHTPSDASSILGVTLDSADAMEGSHTVEVVQIARAHQVRSDAFTSKTTDLSTLGYTTGDFTLNGQTVSVQAGDTLIDLRDKINNLNTGASPTNVSASIVSVSATEHYLTLTSTETGTSNDITFGGTLAVHNDLGFTDVGTTNIKNELQASQDAIIRVDGLGVDITRESNTIDDVLDGVTLDLYKAEADTEIKIDIEADVASIKESVMAFVDAYNALRTFITDQRTEVVRTEGEDPEFGSLAFDTTLRRVNEQLSQLVSTNVPGIDSSSGFASLSQMGITIDSAFNLEIDDDDFDNNLLTQLDDVRRLFAFDFSTSDSRVAHYSHDNNTETLVDGAGALQPYYLNIGGTDASGNVSSANLSETAGAGTANDGTVNIDGNVLTVTDQSGAEGMKLIFFGDSVPAQTDIEISFTRGIADRMFTFFDELTKTSTGVLDTAITNLQDQNADYQEDVEQIDARLEINRQSLTNKFIAMETAMAKLNSLQDTLTQYRESAGGDN